ncbi:MAG: hypothetical protein ACI90V_014228 [Bacillariaceae sp.]|jgi:hypothetical protein
MKTGTMQHIVAMKLKLKSKSLSSWSNPFFALFFAVVVAVVSMSTNKNQIFSSVVALRSPLLLIRSNNARSRTRGGVIITETTNSVAAHTRMGLPLAAAGSSSSSEGGEKKKGKRKSKAKAKAKTASTRKTISDDDDDDDDDNNDDNNNDRSEATTASDVITSDLSSNGDIYYGPQVTVPNIEKFDMTGGRPGSIIESEAELERKEEIMEEMKIDDAEKTGRKKYPKWLSTDYGFLEQDEEEEYDNDDPDALDATTLGRYDITDLKTKFDYEWDPETDLDPNRIDTQAKDEIIPSGKYILETEKDEEGIEVGYNPMFGPSNPIDERTRIGTVDSYMIDVNTRDETMLTPEFFPEDPEVAFNEDIVQYRKSMDIIETYQDDFLPESMPVPRNVAKWYGYPEPVKFESKNYTNNRFTKTEDLTNFDELTPFRARQKAIELARSNNAEWMADGVSQGWHQKQRRPYDQQETLVGTLRKAECDPDTVETIRPALQVLGSCAELLSIEGEHGTVFRFHYHGLIKNKFGMSCWTETLIRDCGVDVTGVIFETGFRARDPAYDGGFPYHGWE